MQAKQISPTYPYSVVYLVGIANFDDAPLVVYRRNTFMILGDFLPRHGPTSDDHPHSLVFFLRRRHISAAVITRVFNGQGSVCLEVSNRDPTATKITCQYSNPLFQFYFGRY